MVPPAVPYGLSRFVMHEVRVYDKAGKLKKVISEKTLTKRSDLQIQSPSLFRKQGRKKKEPTPLTETH
jgi:hypothetical protein